MQDLTTSCLVEIVGERYQFLESINYKLLTVMGKIFDLFNGTPSISHHGNLNSGAKVRQTL